MRRTLICFLSFFLVSAAAAAEGGDASTPVGKVGDTVLSEAQMRDALGMMLHNQELQLFQVKQGWFERTARSMLFEQAAKAAGMAPKAWIAKELAVAPATPDEIKAIAQRMGPEPAEPDRKTQYWKYAEQQANGQKKAQKELEVYRRLAEKQPVQFLLKPPPAPAVAISFTGDNPVKGPKEAPVTIIEFTDIQCPWCKRSQENIRAVEKAFGDKVRLAARQFPLSMHPRAWPAAEAALCAKEQGRFWEYRDRLFETQQLEDADLARHAKELGLKEKKFAACLAGGRMDAVIEQDMLDGQRFGVGGTPTFFVNGRKVSALELESAVRQELESKK